MHLEIQKEWCWPIGVWYLCVESKYRNTDRRGWGVVGMLTNTGPIKLILMWCI